MIQECLEWIGVGYESFPTTLFSPACIWVLHRTTDSDSAIGLLLRVESLSMIYSDNSTHVSIFWGTVEIVPLSHSFLSLLRLHCGRKEKQPRCVSSFRFYSWSLCAVKVVSVLVFCAVVQFTSLDLISFQSCPNPTYNFDNFQYWQRHRKEGSPNWIQKAIEDLFDTYTLLEFEIPQSTSW